ncbi:MAG: hypothetical protein C0501_08060 [Isosphaera sp.]|nr:hypothetical protein [Isosphaera sp.]
MSTDPTAPPPAGGPDGPPPDPNRIDWSGPRFAALVAAAAGAALYLGVGLANLSAAHDEAEAHAAKQRFASAYLTGYTYWLSLPIGAMALLLIGYLAKTSWARLLRRFLEAASRTWVLLALLFVPLAASTFSKDFSPYWWTDPYAVHTAPADANPNAGVAAADKHGQALAGSRVMVEKAVHHEREARERGTLSFLSPKAFVGVGVVLFAIWGTMITVLNGWARQAQGDRATVDRYLDKLNKLGGPGLIVFALTITVGSTQWVMSVEPAWSSTMFPVIFAVNQFLTCYALCLALFLLVVWKPPVSTVVRQKFLLDMGTLLLAFTMFWSYTSFSQYMLIWIGNLPEEIPFYLKRSAGGWWYVSAALCVFHFAVPFLLLLFRDIKSKPNRLRGVATYLLVICAIDVVWWLAPFAPFSGSVPPWLMDVGAILAVGGVWGLFFFHQLRQRPILPTDETYLLPEGHDHGHH